MALLTANQVSLEFSDGRFQRFCVFSVKNADAGDTIDMTPWFTVVKRAGFISLTNTHVLAVAVSGTPPLTLTIPAGPLDDALGLMVVGVSN